MENSLKNRYVRRAKITEAQFRKMVKYFVEDLSATQIADKIQLNRNTVNRYLNEIRGRIVEFCEHYSPFAEEFEEEQKLFLDSKQDLEPVEVKSITKKISETISSNLGYLKRRGKVYAQMIANLAPTKLQNIQKGNLEDENVTVHAVDVQENYGVLAVGYDNSKKFEGKPSYVDDLSKFWNYALERTSKFQGLAKHKFYVHLKECEFRFNFRNDNLYNVILKMLSSNPIS